MPTCRIDSTFSLSRRIRLRLRDVKTWLVAGITASSMLSGCAAQSSLASESRPVSGTVVTSSPLVSRLSTKVITRARTNQKVVALTIDCGGNSNGVSSILTTLRDANVHATFFITGQFARQNPQSVRDIVAAGHVIGNHSDTHPDFSKLSRRAILGQLNSAESAISAAGGPSTKPWFRFPYGASDTTARSVVAADGYRMIGWTVDTLGWMGKSGAGSARAVQRRAVAARTPGEIILMHGGSSPDGSTFDADAMPGIIKGLSKRGYTFATLPELIYLSTSSSPDQVAS